jgi:NADPH:quinone reductase-like Zn-dependent oxidoreductase
VAGGFEAVDDEVEAERELDSGKVTPVIDRTYPLGEAGAAIRRMQNGQARGKLILTV